MSVRIGINPITWSNDDMPELGSEIPLETCLTEMRQAGYAGTELGGKFPRDPALLRSLLARHGLSLVSGWFDGRLLERGLEAEWQAVLPHLTLLRELGAKVVVYAEVARRAPRGLFGPISQRPRLAAAEWPDYGRRLTALAERMADFDLGLAFHHHMGTVVERPAEIDALMAETGPAVGLLYDTGHCLLAGGDPLALLRRHIGRVVHVHCKDARPEVLARARADDMSFMAAVLEGVFTVPGDGCIDFAPLLGVLREHGYAGWLVVEAEQDPRKAHPLTYATMGFRNLSGLARQAGFTAEG